MAVTLRSTAWLIIVALLLLMSGATGRGASVATGQERSLDELLLLASRGEPEPLAALLDKRYPDPRPVHLSMALKSAAADGNIAVVRALLQGGADPDGAATEGRTALMLTMEYYEPNHTSANAGDFTLVVRALLAAGARANAVADNGMTPLFWASMAKLPEAAAALIDAGARVNDPIVVHGEGVRYTTYPIVLASQEASSDVGQRSRQAGLVRVLLGRGADTRRMDSYGKTALARAQDAQLSEVVELLRSR